MSDAVLTELLRFLTTHHDCGQLSLEISRVSGETGRFYSVRCECGQEFTRRLPADDDRYQIIVHALPLTGDN